MMGNFFTQLKPDSQQHSHSHSHGHGHSHGGHGDSHGGDKWVVNWDEWDSKAEMRDSAEQIAQHIITQCDLPAEGATMLDFGCGTGLLLRNLMAKGKLKSGFGTDVEKEMLKVFEKKAETEGFSDKLTSVLLKSTDGREVPEQGTFDIVSTVYVLGHIHAHEIQTTLDNLCAAVKSGGWLVVAEFDNIAEQHEGHGEDDKFVSEGGHAHTSISVEDISTAMIRNGLTVEHVTKNTLDLWGSQTTANLLLGKRM